MLRVHQDGKPLQGCEAGAAGRDGGTSARRRAVRAGPRCRAVCVNRAGPREGGTGPAHSKRLRHS